MSLLRAPLWPLALSGVFVVTGPVDWAAHVLLMVLFVVTACLTALLAARVLLTSPSLEGTKQQVAGSEA